MKFNLLLAALVLAAPTLNASGNRAKQPAPPKESRRATLIAKVISQEQEWDRRSNPLMGRPDILKAVILTVQPSKVLEGRVSMDRNLTIRAEGHKLLLATKGAQPGSIGTFVVEGPGPEWRLVDASLQSRTPRPRTTRVKPSPVPTHPPLPYPEKLGGRQLKKDKAEQAKVRRFIAGKYAMTDAQVVFLTSFSGPAPPSGGYVYWGVKGKIDGVWHVWQRGRLRKGQNLEDPKANQK